MELEKHAIILAVIERLRRYGSWTGKTHVQKTLALLADASCADVPFTFVLYKHGPYSFDVESELEQMCSYSAIDVFPNPDGYGVTICPGKMSPLVRRESNLTPDDEAEIDRVCGFVDSKNVTELEQLATAAWIRRREEISNHQDVTLRLHELKPHVSLGEASTADKELCEFLGLNQGSGPQG